MQPAATCIPTTYSHIDSAVPPVAPMGLCTSACCRMEKRHTNHMGGRPKALFVIRTDHRPSRVDTWALEAHHPGFSHVQKPGSGDRKPEKCMYSDGTPVLDRRFCTPKPRLSCGGNRSVTVEPTAAERMPMSALTAKGGLSSEGLGSSTPMRPLWQRRILMGMRCELPRFSGLILYDEHGQPLRSSGEKEGRQDYHNSQGSPLVKVCSVKGSTVSHVSIAVVKS